MIDLAGGASETVLPAQIQIRTGHQTDGGCVISMKKSQLKNCLEYRGSSADMQGWEYYFPGLELNNIFLPDKINSWIRTDSNPVTDVRHHHRYILQLSLSPEMTLLIDGHKFKLKQGQAILIFPYQRHNCISAVGEQTRVTINFLAHKDSKGSLQPLKNRILDPDRFDFDLLFRVFESRLKSSPFGACDGICALSWFLNRQLEKIRPQDEKSISRKEQRFFEIMSYLEENFEQPLTMKSIARKFNLSESTIRRIFAQIDQKANTPRKVMQHLKMNRSLEWILHTSNSIKEIAEFCGYSDQFTFSRAFRRYTGKSPMQARREFLQHKNGR